MDDNIHRNVLVTVECSSPFESSHIEIHKTLSEDCAVRNSQLARVNLFASQADKDKTNKQTKNL